MEKSKLINQLEACHCHTVIVHFNGFYLPIEKVYDSDGNVIIELKNIARVKGD